MFDLLVDFRRKRDKTDSTDFFWAGWGKSLDYSEENNRKNLLLKKEENNAFDDFSKVLLWPKFKKNQITLRFNKTFANFVKKVLFHLFEYKQKEPSNQKYPKIGTNNCDVWVFKKVHKEPKIWKS